MRIRYSPKAGIQLEWDSSTMKEAFTKITQIDEVFGIDTCGCCGGHELKPVVRENDGYTFYEVRCLNPECRARLDLGQSREGGHLYPRRKDKEGNWLPNNGWSIYKPQGESAATASAPARQAHADAGDDIPF